jgi:esterase
MKLFHRKLGQGPTIIIIHGLYGASDNWMSVARELSNSYEVYMVDQRNHGKSPHNESHTYNNLVDDLKEFMDDQGIEKAILIGHSMGGKTVMFFARQYPERINNLIVIDIAPKDYKNLSDFSQQTIDHLNIINAMSSVDLGKIESRNDVDKKLSETIQSNRVRQFLLKNLHREKDNTFSWSLNIEALKNNLSSILEGFSKIEIQNGLNITGFPILFIKGELSNYITENDFPIIRKIFPYAEIETIGNAGHWVHAEQPEKFLGVIKDFLEG